MSSKASNTNNLTWESPIYGLSRSSRPSQSMEKLFAAGFKTIADLLRILPLRVQTAPKLLPFSHMKEGELFWGECRVISLNFTPAFGRKGKGRAQLFNATLIAQDLRSDAITDLKFFNVYPSLRKSLEGKETFSFFGQVTNYRGKTQVNNPKIDPNLGTGENNLLIEYPTVATVPGKYIKSIIEKIPKALWETPAPEFQSMPRLPLSTGGFENIYPLLHGRIDSDLKQREAAKKDLAYCEFFKDQIKVMARRKGIKGKKAPIISWSAEHFESFINELPYELTKDQRQVLEDIKADFQSGSPMMRIAQGDVGCGKTTVALLACAMVATQGGQVALMCPTEALALQHYQTFKKALSGRFSIGLLLGSQKVSEKKEVQNQIFAGEIEIVIGTHALIQDSVNFKNLQYAIIDEQHKFGVEQRQKLSGKGAGAHTLIMTATPIPRTLQLAQYGDLDISTIRTMPQGRAGTKSRIVSHNTYEKYLSFVKTRLSIGEQVYIVAPAIEESEAMDIKNVEEIEKFYRHHFSEYRIQVLHGRLKAEEKQQTFNDFSQHKIDILISTSVIEVGINVVNATVMSVYNPERFGLSSLHQLRGRVGRGEKPGFFFLIPEQTGQGESLNRLKIIERSNDGFEIAEADLKNRGEGDLFGVSQSGSAGQHRIASIFEHFDVFERVNNDLAQIVENQKAEVETLMLELLKDQKVSSTI